MSNLTQDEQFTHARPQSLVRKEDEEERKVGSQGRLRPIKRPLYDPESTIVSKEEEFARDTSRLILEAATAPLMDPVGTIAGAAKATFGGLPYAAGEIAKYIRDFKDGPQAKTKFSIGVSGGRPGIIQEKPGFMEKYEYYPEPGVRRVVNLDARGNVISSADWDERTVEEVLAKGPDPHLMFKGRVGKTDAGEIQPRLIVHRTPEGIQYPLRARPHRLSAWVRELEKKMTRPSGQGGEPHPERIIWHLYPWREEGPVTVEEIQHALGLENMLGAGDMEYSDLPHYWTGLARGVDSPRPRLRRHKASVEWAPVSAVEAYALMGSVDDELAAQRALDLKKKVPIEETDARLKGVRGELLQFLTDGGGGIGDRKGLSDGAQRVLYMLERGGLYPLWRQGMSRDFEQSIRENMEKLKQAQSEGDLAKARDAVTAVAKGRLEHRKKQVLAGLDFIHQPEVLEEFERLVVDIGSIPLLRTSPAVGPSMPTSFATGQPIIGRGRGQYWQGSEDASDMPFSQFFEGGFERRPDYALTEERIKGARETGAGLEEFSFLERPEWARTGGADLTPSQVSEIRFLAKQLNISERSAFKRTFFGEDIPGGRALPASVEEKIRLAAGGPVTAAIGAGSYLARRIRDEFAAQGVDVWNWVDSLAEGVPVDPELRQEGLPGLYFGEKAVGVPAYAARGLSNAIESAGIGLGQTMVLGYLQANVASVVDTKTLGRTLYSSDAFIRTNYPHLMPEWLTASTKNPFLSWDWFAAGFAYPGEQAMGLLLFPIHVVDLGSRAAGGLLTHESAGESARGIWEFGVGMTEPILQAFARPDWSWENHGFLATSLAWMMAKTPSVGLMKKAIKPYLERLTGGVPLEVTVGQVRQLGSGKMAPTESLIDSVRRMYEELDPLEAESRYSDPVIRADRGGREYIFDKSGPRKYLEDLKTTDEGVVFWENKTTGETVEVTRIDPHSPFARVKDKRGILEAIERRRVFVQERASGLRDRINEYTEALRRDFEVIVNPDLTLEFSPKTKKAFAAVGFGKMEFLKKGQVWTKAKLLKALPMLTGMALKGPAFGGLEAVGRLIALVSSGKGPTSAWTRYLSRSPMSTIPIVVRLLEHQMGWEVRSTRSKYNALLSEMPEQNWGGLSDVLHGEAYNVTLDAARLRDWVAEKGAGQKKDVAFKEAVDSLNERIGAVTVEMTKAGSELTPVYKDAVKRIPALRFNKSTRRWEVDPDVRRVAPKNEINQLESQASLANDFGKNWVEESIRLTEEAIELEMFAHPDGLRQVYWPQTYEAMGWLTRKVRQMFAKTPTAREQYRQVGSLIKELNKKYDLGMGHLPEASLKNRMRRMGVPVEDRGAYFGMIRGEGAFRTEVMHGLARLKRDIEQRKLWRKIVRNHPEVWRGGPTPGFVEVPSTVTNGVKVWGDLAGRWIQEDLWYRMKLTEEFQRGAGSWYTKMLRFWKGMHTHHNVPTLMRNLYTNALLFAPMAGIGLFNPKAWKYYRMALEDFKNYKTSKRFRESIADGTFEGTWSRVEGGLAMSRELADGLFPHIGDFGKNLNGILAYPMKYSKAFGKTPWRSNVKRLLWDLPATAYSWVDDFHRHVYRLYEIGENGTSGKRAALLSREKFIDYENVPGFVQFLRTPHPSVGGTMLYATLGRPFLAFSARAIPLVHKWVQENPIQATMWLNLHDYLTGLSMAEKGITPEEVRIMRDNLPSHMRHRFLPIMSTLKVEYDIHGRKTGITSDWWNAGFLSPWDMFLVRSQQTEPMSATATILAMAGPMAPIPEIIWSIKNNRDAFRGDQVYQKASLHEGVFDLDMRQVSEILSFGARKMISPSLPGGDLWESSAAMLENRPDRYGRVHSQGEIVSKWLALNRVKDVSAQEGLHQKMVNLQRDLRAAKKLANEETMRRWGLKAWNDGLLNGEYGDVYGRSPNIVDPRDPNSVVSGMDLIRERDRRFAEKAILYARYFYEKSTYDEVGKDGVTRRVIFLPGAQTTVPVERAIVENVDREDENFRHTWQLVKLLDRWNDEGWQVRSPDTPDAPGISQFAATEAILAFESQIMPITEYAKREITLQRAQKLNKRAFEAGDKALKRLQTEKAIEDLDPKLEGPEVPKLKRRTKKQKEENK